MFKWYSSSYQTHFRGTEPYGITHTTQVNAPFAAPLYFRTLWCYRKCIIIIIIIITNPSQTGSYMICVLQRIAELTLVFVVYTDSLPVRRQSPIQISRYLIAIRAVVKLTILRYTFFNVLTIYYQATTALSLLQQLLLLLIILLLLSMTSTPEWTSEQSIDVKNVFYFAQRFLF